MPLRQNADEKGRGKGLNVLAFSLHNKQLIYLSNLRVARGTGTPKDRDEVNRRGV